MQFAHDVALQDDAHQPVGRHHHHRADVVHGEPVSSPATEVSGVMVATDAPLFRNTSASCIDALRSVMYFTG